MGELRPFEQRNQDRGGEDRRNEDRRKEDARKEETTGQEPRQDHPREPRKIEPGKIEQGKIEQGKIESGKIANHRVDRRREPRKVIDLPLTVWGIDTKGDQFLQDVHAREISLRGALISGVDIDLRAGDIIGVLYAGRKARFRVVWTRYDGTGDKMQAAIHRLASDICPWREMLPEESTSTGRAAVDLSAPPS